MTTGTESGDRCLTPAMVMWLCGRCRQPALADDTGHALDARDPRTRRLQVNRTPATPTWLCGGCLGELVDDGPGRRRCERTGCGAVFHADDGRPVEDTA